MIPERQVIREGAWRIATVPMGDVFYGWAKMGPILGDCPITELGNHVWFQRGASREECVAKLREELGLR